MIQKNDKQSANTRKIQQDSCHLLYNPNLLLEPSACLLSEGILGLASQVQRVESGGRGQAWFMQLGEVSAVYRHYLRGGLMAKINQQTYFDFDLHKTRSISEWNLLKQMYESGLPVPQPIAASVCRWPFSFSPFYRAQILVERIADVRTLDQILSKQAISDEQWARVGRCIRKFHTVGIYHADLNANNILLNSAGEVYLIDFDKGEQRKDKQKNTPWMQANLQRLKRSLLKQQAMRTAYCFTQKNWLDLMRGYADE